MIRDRLMIGIKDRLVSKDLQLKVDLTLDEAIQTARQAEQVNRQMDQLSGATSTLDVNEVQQSSQPRGTPLR